MVIYPKDVILITGKTERQSRHLLSVIRKKLGKGPGQFVSVREFCAFVGFEEREVVEKFFGG